MSTVFTKLLISALLVGGLAITSVGGTAFDSPYDDRSATKLTRADIETHAGLIFARADRNADGILSADEYTALTIVTAELAHLNGFVVVEIGDAIATAPAASLSGTALSKGEQARINAVARSRYPRCVI